MYEGLGADEEGMIIITTMIPARTEPAMMSGVCEAAESIFMSAVDSMLTSFFLSTRSSTPVTLLDADAVDGWLSTTETVVSTVSAAEDCDAGEGNVADEGMISFDERLFVVGVV